MTATRFLPDAPGTTGVHYEVRNVAGDVIGTNGAFGVAVRNASDHSEYHVGDFLVWACTPDGDVLVSISGFGATEITREGRAFAGGF